jgi:preprotein translocase subunit SecF
MDLLTKILTFVEKNYKKFIIVTIVLFIIFIGTILFNYLRNGYILNKSIDISGGYITMINNNYHITNQEVNNVLYKINVTNYIIYNTPSIIYIESGEKINTSELIYLFNSYYNIPLSSQDISVQQYSSIVGNIIFNQFVEFVFITMVLVGLIIFIAFRVSNVTLNIMSTIAFDILGLLAILSTIKYPIGANGFIAMLMILGFAIDNNVVLSTNIVKEKEKPFIEKVKMSFRVGMLMELIALYTLIILYLFVPVPSVREFSIVLFIAIILDLLYYLIGNIPIYKYFESKKES